MDEIVFTVPSIKQELLDIKEEPSSSTDVYYTNATVKQEPDHSLTDDKEDISNTQVTKDTKKRKIMRSQARELIAAVYQHMKKEAVHGVENVTDARWRTSQATGVSEKTVSRILKEKKKADETGIPITSPHRNKKPRKCLRRDIEERDVDVIKETISAYETEFNKPPSLSSLKKLLKEKIGFNGCIETLRRLMGEIGYEFKTTMSNSISSRSKVLVEKI